MLEAEYLIFCKSISVEENGFTLVQTFDTIFFTNLPTIYNIPFVALAKVRTKKVMPEGVSSQEIKIEHEGGTVFSNKKTFSGRYTPKDHVLYIQADLLNLKFDKAGKHHVNLFLNGSKVISRPLYLEQADKKEIFDEQKIIQAID